MFENIKLVQKSYNYLKLESIMRVAIFFIFSIFFNLKFFMDLYSKY